MSAFKYSTIRNAHLKCDFCDTLLVRDVKNLILLIIKLMNYYYSQSKFLRFLLTFTRMLIVRFEFVIMLALVMYAITQQNVDA